MSHGGGAAASMMKPALGTGRKEQQQVGSDVEEDKSPPVYNYYPPQYI